MKLLKILFSLAAVVLSVALVALVFPGDPSLILGTLIFVAPGGVGVNFNFNMTYLPEYITFNDGGNPLNFLRIETKEDGMLHDWNAAAIAAMNGFMNVGAMAANQVRLPVADGRINGKNVTVTGQTSALGAINIFVGADNIGTSAFKTQNAAILALNPTRFEKFTALFLPALVTVTDRAEVQFADGHREIFDATELAALSAAYQNAPAQIVNNANSYIKYVEVVAAIAQAAYVLKVNI